MSRCLPVGLLSVVVVAADGADTVSPERVRYDRPHATVYYEAGRLSPAEMERFADLVDRGIGDVETYLGSGVVRSGRITYYVSNRIAMSRAFRRTVLLPLERVRNDQAPYLHETTHVVLPTASDCMWLGEGFASYVESYVSEHMGGYDAGVFSKGGNRDVDRAARRHLGTADGRAVLPFVGVCGTPADIESERSRVAAPFYVLSQSFVKYLVDKAGVQPVSLAHASPDVAASIERSTGRALEGWKADWLAALERRRAEQSGLDEGAREKRS